VLVVQGGKPHQGETGKGKHAPSPVLKREIDRLNRRKRGKEEFVASIPQIYLKGLRNRNWGQKIQWPGELEGEKKRTEINVAIDKGNQTILGGGNL